MLYAMPELASDDMRVLDELAEIRRDLHLRVSEPHSWTGQLGRNLQARAIQASNAIEGYQADIEDAESLVAGSPPLEAPPQVTRELAGYRLALGYVQALGRAAHFQYDLGLLNALNYMMIGHHREKSPGILRPSAIFIRNHATGAVVYEGPDAEDVPDLMAELVTWLNDGDLAAPAYVRAAMAHFNLVGIHPWRDGNGRMSRALHTLLLARDHILSPEFSSIEEWLGTGRNTYDYYDALQAVRTEWRPEGAETHSWVRFCLRAHHMQAQQVQRRLTDAADVWLLLEEKIAADGLPTRCVAALHQVYISNRLRRATYQSDESLSPGQATRDLRELARRDWRAPYGETKGRFYPRARR